MSDNSVRILVVEDNQKHIDDAFVYASQLKNCIVDFAPTLAIALLHLESKKYNGIISDVFFPETYGENADGFENAIALNEKALELKTHIVFNTSGNHHGKKYREFRWMTPKAIHDECQYHILTSGMVIESYPEENDDDLDFKQWQATFRYLLLVHEILSEAYTIPNDISLDNGQPDYIYYGFPFGDYGQLTTKFNQTKDLFALKVFAKYNT